MGSYIKFNRKPPPPAEPKRKRNSRQKRKTMNEVAEYHAIRDLYLEQNGTCAYSGGAASEVDHIVSGTAGKAISRLNPDTWNPSSAEENAEHHKIEVKLLAKLKHVWATVERLRTGGKLSDAQDAYVLEGLAEFRRQWQQRT